MQWPVVSLLISLIRRHVRDLLHWSIMSTTGSTALYCSIVFAAESCMASDFPLCMSSLYNHVTQLFRELNNRTLGIYSVYVATQYSWSDDRLMLMMMLLLLLLFNSPTTVFIGSVSFHFCLIIVCSCLVCRVSVEVALQAWLSIIAGLLKVCISVHTIKAVIS